MEVIVKLDINEVNAILSVLGDLPSKTRVYPLMVKISEQVEVQIPKQDTPAE